MKRQFHWETWNREHISKHSVTEKEAEDVINRAKPPYPRKSRNGKLVVWGSTEGGRLLQVIFVNKGRDEIDYELMTLEEILKWSVRWCRWRV